MSGLGRPNTRNAEAMRSYLRRPCPVFRLRLLTLAVLLIAPLGRTLHAQAATPRAEIPMSTWQVPSFSLPTMGDSTFSIDAHRGQVVVVNFWATWCRPCLIEMPEFARLQAELAPQGLTFVGVSIDAGGWLAVRPFAERLGVNYPIVLDDGRMAERFGASGIMPVTYVVDRGGRIRVVAEGSIPYDDLRPILLSLLAE